MQITQRRFLLLLLIVGQCACMLLAMAWATNWLRSELADLVRNRALAEGRALALDLAARAERLDPTAFEPRSEAWDELRTLCGQTKTPDAGRAIILRLGDGALLCSSGVGARPELLETHPGKALLESTTDAGPLHTALERTSERSSRTVAGRIVFEGALWTVSATRIPHSDAAAAILQDEQQIDQAIASLVQPMYQVGYALTVFLIGATSILTTLLVNRYETNLAHSHANLEMEVRRRTDSLLRTRNAVVFGLAKLAESRDCETGKHLERIQLYVTVLARELAHFMPEIDEQYVADLAVASSLHDIGKVGIPDRVLLKPGALSPEERSIMERHTIIGAETLATIRDRLGPGPLIDMSLDIAQSHHERWDGNGYPAGLSGEDIPLAARIVSLADVYDALTSARVYKPAFPHERARAIIIEGAGTQFDPRLVAAFQKVADRFEIVCRAMHAGDPPIEGISDAAA